jgi:hypothetical protein
MLAASHLTKQQVHISSWILQFQSPVRWSIVGGWAYPSEKWWSESQLGWWNIWNSQYDGKVIKFHGSKAPSSIYIYIYHINSTVSEFFCSIRLVLKNIISMIQEMIQCCNFQRSFQVLCYLSTSTLDRCPVSLQCDSRWTRRRIESVPGPSPKTTDARFMVV